MCQFFNKACICIPIWTCYKFSIYLNIDSGFQEEGKEYMFSFFNTTPPDNTQKNESSLVDDFRKNSYEFKEISRLALASHNEDMKVVVNKINNATSFSQLLEITERFDFENTSDPSIKGRSRNEINTLLYTLGFVNNEANFAYHLLHFRENTIKYMAEQGYSYKPPANSRPK